jgi:hydroxymethylglutaryl-CoA reductase
VATSFKLNVFSSAMVLSILSNTCCPDKFNKNTARIRGVKVTSQFTWTDWTVWRIGRHSRDSSAETLVCLHVSFANAGKTMLEKPKTNIEELLKNPSNGKYLKVVARKS